MAVLRDGWGRGQVGLRNTRTGAWLASDLTVARGFWPKMVGLLGRRSMASGEGLLLEPCNSIHSFFMAFAFDALFVDKGWRVVHSVEAMPPFRVSRLVWRGHAVVELPAGAIGASGTRVGDVLEVAEAGSPPL